jgi:tellurite resistance protein TehA-like permease
VPETIPLLVLQFGLSLAACAAVGWWFIRPWLQAKPVRTALSILLVPQLFRHVGISLLVPEIVDPTFPEAMALQTAIGDTAAALLAWVALVSIRVGWRHAMAAVWTFNLFGLTDMILNLRNGIRLQVADDLGAAWFGIAFVVPLMLVVHGLIFAFLFRARGR